MDEIIIIYVQYVIIIKYLFFSDYNYEAVRSSTDWPNLEVANKGKLMTEILDYVKAILPSKRRRED